MSYSHLFSPIQLNQLTIKNRVLSTAHAEVYADAGVPNKRYIDYYEEKAKGGLGLAICGGSSPVSIDSPQSWWKSIDLTKDTTIPHLNNLAEAMHRHGAKIMIQATHMGRRSSYFGGHWPHLVSPSGIREPVHRGNAKTIEKHEIRRILKDFGKAAKRVQDSGLDGIEISCAHQHLVDQFWSPRTNMRVDEFGGSLENRLRFGIEMFSSIREMVGSDFCVGMRMCGDEFHHNGLDHQALKEIATAMSETGLIDFISVIGSGADTHNTLANCMPPMALPPNPFSHLAAGIKSVVDLPVMHAQSIKDPKQAEQILELGMCDLVGMTRAHIADPHLVNKTLEGRENQIRQCVGANYCIDRQYLGQDVLCIQNAATSREAHMPHIITASKTGRRRVVVIGAGPAGLEAARVAKERGHQVLLYEQSDATGGQVRLAAKPPQRDQMAGIIRWFDMEIQRLGVELQLNTTATGEMILAQQPDIVVIATGGHSYTYENQHWQVEAGLAVSSWDILAGTVEAKSNVLVYDSGSSAAGAGVADLIASKGALVEIVTPEPKVADDAGGTTFPIFYRSLCAKGVIFSPNLMLEKVYKEGEDIIALLQHEYSGLPEERVVEQVVIENGTMPNDSLYLELKDGSRNQGIADIELLYSHQPQRELLEDGEGYLLYRVGEAVCARNIHGCIYDSLRLAKDF